jgi:hypothetical protein
MNGWAADRLSDEKLLTNAHSHQGVKTLVL